MLTPGERVPEFIVTTIDGRSIEYASLWQRRNLLLISIPSDDPAFTSYVSELTRRTAELTAHETSCVITTDHVRDAPRPGVVVADRWGEIHFVTAAAGVAGLPDVNELIEWLRFVQVQCPECQGETR